LSVTEDVAAARGGFGQERYEKAELQRRVKDAFTLLQKDSKDASDWRTIDASMPIEEIHWQIQEIAANVLYKLGSEIRTIQ
jgi:dTMP kinase